MHLFLSNVLTSQTDDFETITNQPELQYVLDFPMYL